MLYYRRKNTEPLEIMRARCPQNEEEWELITEEEYIGHGGIIYDN